MRKLLISSAVAATVLATAGMANIATDGTGQFLVAPGYFATEGYETKVKLVNTNTTKSVLYRGVIREYEASQEVDFIVLLSPSDVWEARIYRGEDGSVYLQSSDDSNYGNGLVNPVDLKNLYKQANKVERSFKKGYVEFYPIASFQETSDAIVKKSTLKDRFDALAARATTTPAADLVGNDDVAGYVTVTASNLDAVMTIPMTAFENVQTTLNAPAGAGEDTDPTLYIDPDVVYADLSNSTLTVPYEANGVNDGIYLAFWGDYLGADKAGCTQYRSYQAISRDMEENRGISDESVISPAPKNAPNTVECEFGTIQVKKMLKLAGTPSYQSGMVQLTDFKTEAGDQSAKTAITSPGKTAFIASNISARPVGDSKYSFSWVYAPVK